jgi:hypothetical protein
MAAIAEIVTFPARAAGGAARATARQTVHTLRTFAVNAVDDWGRDAELVGRFASLARLRWDVTVGGVEHVPARAGALIVVNTRRFALAPMFAALALGDELARPVRFVGRPDVAPLGPMLQRLGALLPIAAELEGALRAGELVVLGAQPRHTNSVTGTIDHHLVGAAVAAKVKVLPAATLSSPMQRTARVEVGRGVRPQRLRRGPLAELELADLAADRVDGLLAEAGGDLTGTPLDWMPNGWLPADWRWGESLADLLAVDTAPRRMRTSGATRARQRR